MRIIQQLPRFLLFAAAITTAGSLFAQVSDTSRYQERLGNISRMEAAGLAEPFKGITTDGEVVTGLFPLRSTGVSTQPVQEAALRFLQTLEPAQREDILFPVEDEEWRKWANQSIYDDLRQGLSFEAMSQDQREAAFDLLAAALSAKGLKLSRDIMHLNETLAELSNNFEEYGEWKYWLSFMGEPSTDEPWGWQLDGHHLNLNYFVLGDQVVMTPSFWGSEPAVAETGKYAGTAILQEEQDSGLRLLLALDPAQREAAVLREEKTGNNIMTEAFSDNVVLDFAGVSAATFNDSQKAQLLELIGLYVGNLRKGHAAVRMEEVEAHLDATRFAWIGGDEEDSVYYYRIQSPVLLIEFDHEVPVGLRHLHTPGVPYQEHIHAVVRTPNGNDYGKDLLRQHYEQHPH